MRAWWVGRPSNGDVSAAETAWAGYRTGPPVGKRGRCWMGFKGGLFS